MTVKAGYKPMLFNIESQNAEWLSKQDNMSRFINVLIDDAKRKKKHVERCPRCRGEGVVSSKR